VARRPRTFLLKVCVGTALAVAMVLALSSTSASKSPTAYQVLAASEFKLVSLGDPKEPTLTADSSQNIPMGHFTYVPAPDPTAKPTAKPTPKPTAKPKPAIKPRPRLGSGRVRGSATYYCWPGRSRCTRGFPSGGAYGAAGPELRRALGNWRGKTVYVNGVRVKLIDWCACGGNHVIDVYHSTWVKIPHPSSVTIRW